MKKYSGNTEETFQMHFLWLNNTELLKSQELHKWFLDSILLTMLGRPANATFFCPSEEKKEFYFTSSWIFKRSAFHHISLNCHVKPSSHWEKIDSETGKGKLECEQVPSNTEKLNPHAFLLYLFSFILIKVWEFLNCKIIKDIYIVIDVNKKGI